MINLRNIIQGWWNLTFPDPKIEVVAKKRLEICKTCIYNSANQQKYGLMKWMQNIRLLIKRCNKCGCPLEAKTRAMGERCPYSKWKEVNT